VAKNKAKISQAQRDKYNIYVAKTLKKAGIISKQAKLHSGAYISRSVLKKVREYEAQAKLGYKAYSAPKAVVKAAKERGFQTVGGKIIGPPSATFRNRLKRGDVTGIKPVKGGFMEEVVLPHTVYDMRSLVEQLKEGIDTLKLPNEQFAIKYKGFESYRAFMNTQQLLDYLQHYRGFEQSSSLKPEELQEEFDALTILRLHPADVRQLIRGPQRRKEDWKKARMEKIARGEYIGTPVRRRGKSRLEKAYNMPQAMGEAYLKRMAAKDREKRMNMSPEKMAEYRAKARKRSQASRDRKKGK
jgi:hypothetical protein